MSEFIPATGDIFAIMYVDENGVDGLIMQPKEMVAQMKAAYGDNVIPIRSFPTREEAQAELDRFFRRAPPEVKARARVVGRAEIEAFTAREGGLVVKPKTH